MKTTMTGLVALACLAATDAIAEQPAPDHNDWYMNHYAPLWAENPWEKRAEIEAQVADAFVYHQSNGTVQTVDGKTWLSDGLEEWQAEGWVGSDVAGYESDRINATTASFKVKWRDRYDDGSVYFECGWYLADLQDGRWRVTGYADVECDDHDW